jgi:endonuclease YncB( thermonuclease family)
MSIFRVVPVLASVLILVVASCQTGAPLWTRVPGNDAAAVPDPTGCDVLNVIDGDTINLVCRGHGEVRARLLGYDAPEIFDPGCAEERRLGRAAAQRLREAINGAGVVDMRFEGADRYGRYLVRLDVDGVDIAETLLAEGFARRYAGGRRANWCAQSG